MRVLHVPFCYHPDPVGGTEVYVEGLVRHQRGMGIEAIVAAPGSAGQTYEHDGVRVFRFGGSASLTLEQLYGAGDPFAAESFREILERVSPDIVHLHSFTSSVSMSLVRQCRERRVPVVFTYHTPTVSCLRGTLLEFGTSVCDGKIETRRCAQCSLHGQGLSRPVSRLVGSMPAIAGRVLGRVGLSGGVWTALRMAALSELRHQGFQSFMAEVDQVVAVCLWARAVLVANGVPAGKITLCRQGILQAGPGGGQGEIHSPVRIVFLGRADRTKGLEILLEAVEQERGLPLELSVYAVAQTGQERVKLARWRDRFRKDPRVRFSEPVPPGEIPKVLSGFDYLAVPSIWLESGPLVVYEAYAAGLPVIGSDLGGIAELVEHEKTGLLVAPGSVDAWRAALRRVVASPELHAELQAGLPPPRTMGSVAEEMRVVYEKARAA